MTAEQRTALRARQYTYYEMLAFAQFYQLHRNENSPSNLLCVFLKWKLQTAEVTLLAQRLLVIEEVVVNYYGLSLQEVRGKRRYAELVRARQVISYLTVRHASQQQIATTLGANRNNIQFGKTKCATLMLTEPLLKQEVEAIEKRLEIPFAELDQRAAKMLDKELTKEASEDNNLVGN